MTEPNTTEPWLQDFARITWDCWRLAQGNAPSPASAPTASLQAAIAEHYRRLFAPPMAPTIAATDATAGLVAALARCQRAALTLAARAAAIASDAARRLCDELSRASPPAPPITTLRELHALWVECGEAAWAAAVREDGYVDAQGEWLAALVELQSEQLRLTQAAAPEAS